MTYSYRYSYMRADSADSKNFIHMMDMFIDDTKNEYIRLNHHTKTGKLVWLYFKPKIAVSGYPLTVWIGSTEEEAFQGSLIHEYDCAVVRDVQECMYEKMYRASGKYDHLERSGEL